MALACIIYIPNLLGYARIILLVLGWRFLAPLFEEDESYAAKRSILIAAILILSAWSLDALDGSLARKLKQTSHFGAIVDQVCDILGHTVTALVGLHFSSPAESVVFAISLIIEWITAAVVVLSTVQSIPLPRGGGAKTHWKELIQDTGVGKQVSNGMAHSYLSSFVSMYFANRQRNALSFFANLSHFLLPWCISLSRSSAFNYLQPFSPSITASILVIMWIGHIEYLVITVVMLFRMINNPCTFLFNKFMLAKPGEFELMAYLFLTLPLSFLVESELKLVSVVLRMIAVFQLICREEVGVLIFDITTTLMLSLQAVVVMSHYVYSDIRNMLTKAFPFATFFSGIAALISMLAFGLGGVIIGGLVLPIILSLSLYMTVFLPIDPSDRIERIARFPCNFARLFHVLLATACYSETSRFIKLQGGQRFIDSALQVFDESLFGYQPAEKLYEKIPLPLWMGEWLHISYGGYITLVGAGLLFMAFRCNNERYYRFLRALMLTFVLNFVSYQLFPALGPTQLLDMPSPDKVGYFMPHVAKRFGETHASLGTAFPSGHCDIAIVITLFVLQESLFFGIIFGAVSISLSFATVWCGYHYFADVLYAVAIAAFAIVRTQWPQIKSFRKKELVPDGKRD